MPQTNAVTYGPGVTFCGSAQVATQGSGSGASGTFVIWLLDGPGGSEPSSKHFANLPGGNAWTQVQACVTATREHPAIRIQCYPAANNFQTPPIENVDAHASLAVNGGFNHGFGSWQAMPQTNAVTYGPGVTGNDPYEGTQFAATNTSDGNGGIYQDVPVSIKPGDTFCGSAQVATQGSGSGASGTFVIWLLDGPGGSEPSSKYFANLPGGNAWTQVQACVTATREHPAIRIQFYPPRITAKPCSSTTWTYTDR